MRIAVLSEVHFGEQTVWPLRGELGLNILQRAVNRFNRFVRPDVVIVAGDIVDDGYGDAGAERLLAAKKIIEQLRAETIVIRGNHDGGAEDFYTVFEKPKDYVDIAGVRFVCFDDAERAGFNAERSEADIERLRNVRFDGFGGSIVCVQHTPLCPAYSADCPFYIYNSEAIIDAMKEAGAGLSISGHFHNGFDIFQNGIRYLSVAAVCEKPFRYAVIDVERDGAVNVEQQQFAADERLELVDMHVHSEFAYCSEDMDIAKAVRLGEDFGVKGVCFTEHSGQLYFGVNEFMGGAFCARGLGGADDENDRADMYFGRLAECGVDKKYWGLEVDVDFAGEAVIKDKDRQRAEVLMGAVHFLKAGGGILKPSIEQVCDEVFSRVEKMFGAGIKILAHPLRIFDSYGYGADKRVHKGLVEILRKYGAAAEINFHKLPPAEDFVRMCIEAEVQFSLGSDSHSLCRVGELWPQERLLRECAGQQDIKELLIDY